MSKVLLALVLRIKPMRDQKIAVLLAAVVAEAVSVADSAQAERQTAVSRLDPREIAPNIEGFAAENILHEAAVDLKEMGEVADLIGQHIRQISIVEPGLIEADDQDLWREGQAVEQLAHLSSVQAGAPPL